MKKIHILLIALFTVSAISKADDNFGYTKNPDTSSSDSRPVLQFAGDFDVSSLGAATYTVPIDVPAGVGGMQPSLSLAYSSQSSVGLAGQGFDLKGLGAITRGPKSVFHDEMSSGTTYKKDDAFYLNGERLILVDESDATDVVYRVASDPTTKIIARYGGKIVDKDGNVTGIVPGNSPRWQVITKDGTIYTYGVSLSSVPGPNGSGPILQYAWYLSYVKDKLGNYMSVKYEQENYYLYPKSITYGKNINVTSTLENTVTIDYEDLNASGTSLSEHHKFAFGNVVGDISRRVKSIVCKSGNSVYCEYLFNYNKIESKDLFRCYSVLSSVTKKKGDEDVSIKFKWQEDPKTFAMNASKVDIKPYEFISKYPIEYETKGDRVYFTADLNGDGVSDIIEMTKVVKKVRRYSDEELHADKNLNGIPDLIDTHQEPFDPFFPTPSISESLLPEHLDKNKNGIPDATELEALKYQSVDEYKSMVIYASSIDENGIAHYSMVGDSPVLLRPEEEFKGNDSSPKSLYSVQISDLNGDGFQDVVLPYYRVIVDNKAKYYSSKFRYWLDYYVIYGAKTFDNIECVVRSGIYDGTDNEIKSCNIPTVDCTSDEGKKLLNPGKVSANWTLTPLYATFDIDNNGQSDILTIEPYRANNYGCRCYIKMLNSEGTFDTHVCFLNLDFPVGTTLFASDYNKDGMIDIMVVNMYGCYIFYNQGKDKGFFSKDASAHDKSLTNYQNDIIREGDFDGDGYADYFYIKANDNIWHVAYGNAMRNGTNDALFTDVEVFKSNVHDLRTVVNDDDKFTVLVYDANNDGLSDVFVSKTEYDLHHTFNGNTGKNPGTISFIFCSTGNRTKTDNCSQFVEQFYGEYDGLEDKSINWNLGDFFGNGRPSLLHYSDNESHVVFTNGKHRPAKFMAHTCTSDRKALKVIRITDAMDNNIDISYAPLMNGNVYSYGTPAKFPVVSRPLPMDVVSSVKASNGHLPSVTTTYRYKGLRTHMQGLGVLGFEERSVTNETLGMTTTSRIDSYDPNCFLPTKTSSSVVISRNGEKYETKSAMTYVVDDIPNGNGAYFYHQVKKEDTDIYGHTACVDYEYDIVNAVLKMEKSYFKGEESSMYKLMQYYYPSAKTYKGALLPERISSIQKHKDDSNVLTLWTKFVYNPDGLLSVKIDNYNQNDATKGVKTTYEYDAFGNTTKTTVSGTDIKTLSTINRYDETGRFVEKTYTEPLSTTVENTYDVFGNCLATTEYDDENYKLTTTYEYDTWGNPIRVTSPNGNINVVSLGWGYSSYKKYYKLTQGTHTPWVKTWYNSMGKEIETESVGAKDICVKAITNYDSYGNVASKESIVGNRKVTETIHYDAYGRVVKTESSTGEVTTTSYDDRSVTVSNGKKTVTKELDSWGNPTRVDDGLCEVTYKYYSNGNPSEIKSGSDVTKFEYDEVGNKTSMKTSDRGTITYKYNVLGECIYTKDGNRVYQDKTYDELGRVTEKQFADQSVGYFYIEDGKGTNQIECTELYDDEGYLVAWSSYEYDEFGRVVLKEKEGETTRYEYYPTGEIKNINISGNKDLSVGITYKYDCYGNKSEIYVNGDLVWKVTENTGNTVGVQLFGNNCMEHRSSCDNLGRVLSDNVTWRGASVLSMSYSYDTVTGNMTSRTGMMKRKELFDYDDYDRLTTFVSLDGTIQGVDYSGSGNIIYKSDLGTYRYQYSSKPNRLTQLDNEEGACPLDSREISYNGWNRVSKIKDSGSGYEMTFEYDENGNRNWSKLTKNGTLVREIEYTDHIEHVKTKSGDEFFVYLGDNLLYHYNEHIEECLYLCTDHLGSVVKIVDSQYSVLFEAKYDAWGNQEVVKNDIGFIRGYTGHEEIPEFGIINMNARLYDPMLGRFLSPDNFVQSPENSQNYNRYAYCLNNPLKYNDPSGNCIGAVGAVIATVAFAMVSSACETSMNHGDFGMFAKNFGMRMLSTAAGNLSSVAVSSVTGAIGTAFGHTVGSFWNEALRAGAHGLFNGCVNAANGGNFLSGFAAGAVSSSTGSLAQWGGMSNTGVIMLCTATGSLASGLFEGGNGNAFMSGAMTGYSIGRLNHCGGDKKNGFWKRVGRSISSTWNSIKEAFWGNPIGKEIEHLKTINLKEVVVSGTKNHFENFSNPIQLMCRKQMMTTMFFNWVYGIGPSNMVFYNDYMANSFRNSWQVNVMREQYYNTGVPINGKGRPFGLEGALRAGTDPIEQFVGGYDISVKPIENGTLLQFTIENTTSFHSFMLHQDLAPKWERSTFPIMGNMRQTYIFTEPIRR